MEVMLEIRPNNPKQEKKIPSHQSSYSFQTLKKMNQVTLIFITAPLVKRGRDQHVAILLLFSSLLFFSSHLLDQSEQSINLDALL